MAEKNQFGSSAPGMSTNRKDCLRYEAMLADVVDGTLSPEDQADFDRHLQSCDSCSSMLMDAQRGAKWLEVLRSSPPEPAKNLIDRILAETSVRSADEAEAARQLQRDAVSATSLLGRPASNFEERAGSAMAPAAGKLLPFPRRIAAKFRPALHTVLQTRFAMTAAMAFFSVALTLNLTGVHVTQVRARDLRPANLRRSFYEANAHVVRYYENLRVVYELESRVRDLQHSSDADTPVQQEPQQQRSPNGSHEQPSQPAEPKTSPTTSPANRPRSSTPGGGNDSHQSSSRSAGRPGAGSELRTTPEHRLARHPVESPGQLGEGLPVSFRNALPHRQQGGLV